MNSFLVNFLAASLVAPSRHRSVNALIFAVKLHVQSFFVWTCRHGATIATDRIVNQIMTVTFSVVNIRGAYYARFQHDASNRFSEHISNLAVGVLKVVLFVLRFETSNLRNCHITSIWKYIYIFYRINHSYRQTLCLICSLSNLN